MQEIFNAKTQRREGAKVALSAFASLPLCISIGRNRRGPRRFFLPASHVSKRLECVQLAGAFGAAWSCGKREQAPRTPNASRDWLAARPRCALALNSDGIVTAKRIEVIL